MPIIVTSDFPPARGGIQSYCAGIASALVEIGERVLVIAPEHVDAAAFDAGVPYPVLRLRRRGRIGSLVAMALATRRARSQRKGERVIAASWYPPGIAAILAGAIGPARLTIVTHGSEVAKQRRSYRKLLAYNVLRRADVVAVSAFTAGVDREIGVAARVVPCGVVPFPLERETAPDPIILFVGRLQRRKGVDRLIGAMPDLIARFPGVRLEIIGSGPDRTFLEDLARELHVEGHVTFQGQVADADLQRSYRRAWCFAMPNRTEGGFDVEGFGMVFLEAAMHGLPSVGGRFSGAEDAIEDGNTGFLVDGRSQGEVTGALARLVGDAAYAASLGRAGRERALRDFRWPDIAARVVRGAGRPPASSLQP